MRGIRKAVIPAAGMGTRFLPATKALPKEMLPIVDKPVIQYVVEEAAASGIEDILIISGRHKRAIEDHFDQSNELEALLKKKGKDGLLKQVKAVSNLANIHYIRQKEPNGLGDALLQARHFIGSEPFALMLGDDIVETPGSIPSCTQQLIKQYETYHHPIIGVQTVALHDVDRYGIIRTDRTSILPGETVAIHDLVEKPNLVDSPSRIAIMGRYILNADIFDFLSKVSPGFDGEIQLTDALRLYNQYSEMRAYGIIGIRHDIGNPLGFFKANLSLASKDPYYRSILRPLVEDWLENHYNLKNEEAL